MTTLDEELLNARLEEVRQMLAADDFHLDIELPADGDLDPLVVTVVAGPTACAQCLIPVDLSREILTAAAGDALGLGGLTVNYPDL